MDRYYITTAIPYVNALPHIGFAMELVLADAVARHRRLRGDDVRFVTGTDENSLKNVQAAEALGVPTAELVERNAAAFRALRESLDLSFDDFIRTSAEARHRDGAAKLWRACVARGDVYKRAYRGLYCVGCEQFYGASELEDGRCPEHGVVPDVVEEDNWFFALSRYQSELLELLESGRLRVVPEHYRNEVLAFVRGGLQDFSISRSSTRARGWGIEVPGDPEQVMYVWFDALGNYITALDYGAGEAVEGERFARYWRDNPNRVHVIGKGITRFHAVYWPAILLSAGLSLPSVISVHGYLTVEGKKIGKSLGNAIDPNAVVHALGVDPVRYFLARHIRTGRDGDFSSAAVVRARDTELADQLGNLLSRTVAMVDKYYAGVVPAAADDGPFAAHIERVRAEVERAFDEHRIDAAIEAAWTLVEQANRFLVERAPWTLAKRRDVDDNEAVLASTLHAVVEVLRVAALCLWPVIPGAADAIHRGLGRAAPAPGDWDEVRWGSSAGIRVRPGPPLFPKDPP